MGGRPLEYRVLGPVDVVDAAGRSLGLGGPKQRLVLALLLVRRNEVVSVERLVTDLWGDEPPRSAATMVHGYVSKLRKALDGEVGDDGEAVLRTRPGGYQLRVRDDQVDSTRFERLADEGARVAANGACEDGARMLEAAISLWRGSPFADLAYEPALQDEIRRLEEERLGATQSRIDADLALGRCGRLVPELEALCVAHPLEERLHAQLMLALYRSGRVADALAVYGRLRQRLADDLGLEPGGELRALETSIIRREPSLDPGAIAAGGVVTEAHAGPRRRRLVGVGASLAGVIVVSAALAAALAERDTAASDSSVAVGPSSVAVVDPRTNRIVADVPVGSDPGAPVFDGDFVWTASATDRTVSRIDARRPDDATSVGIVAEPRGLLWAFGRLWVATPGALTRVHPRYATVEGRVMRIPGSQRLPAALAASRRGVLVAERGLPLLELDPRTGHALHSYAAAPNGEALAVRDGVAWVGTAGVSLLTRIDMRSGAIRTIPLAHSPTSLAVGFGSVWAVLAGDGAVWRIDPDSLAVQSSIQVGGDPRALVLDPEGQSVWVANGDAGTVVRIDPAVNEVVSTIRTGGSASGIAVAAGRVWVSVRAAKAAAGDGQLHLVTAIPTGEGLGIAAAAGSIWVTERREGRLARIDPRTNRVVRRIWTGPAKEPVAGLGAVWLPTNERLVRIDPSHNSPAGSAPGPYNEAAVGAGAVWALTYTTGPNRLDRIDPRTMTVTATLPVPAFPGSVAVGGGSVWVCGGDLTRPFAGGWILRVDPVSARVVARIELARVPRFMAFGFGSLWVTVHGAVLDRIDPATNDVRARIRTSKGGAYFQDYVAIGRRSVWVTNLNNAVDGEVVEVDPRANRAVARAPLAQGPAGVVEAFGSVWVAHFVGARVLRFDAG